MAYRKVPTHFVYRDEALHGAYLTLEDAQEIKKRLVAKGVTATIKKRVRVW